MVTLQLRLSIAILTLLVLTKTASSAAPPAESSAAVAGILKRHCAGCHGQQARPKGGLGQISDLHHLLDSGQVIPGQADRSPLWQRIEAGEMPPKASKTVLTRGDADLVRRWIAAGAALPSSAIKPVAEADLLPAVAADLETIPARERRFVRYLSLANLARQPARERQTLHHGLTKLLNSLSWHARLSVPHLLPGKLLYRIDLRHYRWAARQWDRLTAAYPYATREADAALLKLAEMTASQRPVVRADWFVAVASRPPAYHDLLGLPSTDRALERLAQVDSATSLEEGTAVRAGFNGSGVARANRVIERQDSVYGAYWRSFDFTDNTSRQNLFAYPLGPNPGPAGFRHAGGEIIFHLPNGLQGYLLVDGDGKRVDRAPGAIVSDPKRPDRLVENGLSCMGCHVGGIIPKDDQVRAHVLGNARAFSAEVKADVLALYVPAPRMKQRIAEDNERFAAALRKLEIPAGDPEPISAVVLRQEQTVTLARAAEELGVDVDRLAEALRGDGERGRILGPLRSRGTVQREVFEEAFAGLLDLVAPKRPIARVATPRGPFRGHQGAVRALAWAPDGRQFASAAADGEVRLWDLATAKSRLLGKHSDEALAVAFSADGKRLLSGGADRVVRLWDVASGQLLAQLIGHTAGVRAVAFAGSGDEAVSGGEDRTIRLWDLKTRSQKRALAGHRKAVVALAVSRDGKTLVSGGSDRCALLWRLADGRQIRRFDCTHEVSAVAFSDDGRRVVLGGADRAVGVYEADRGGQLRRVGVLSGTVVGVALGDNGRKLVSVSRGAADAATVGCYQMTDGKRLRASGPGLVEAAAIAVDGRVLVATDRVIHLVRAE